MNNARRTVFSIAAIIMAIVAALTLARQAHAGEGEISVKNCDENEVTGYLYDWKDGHRGSASSYFEAYAYGGIGDGSCRKNWWTPNSPGCWVVLDYTSNEEYDIDFESKRYSGAYTAWLADDGNASVVSGYAKSCAALDHFQLTGSVLGTCTDVPELTLYGELDKGGDAFTLQNFSKGDMTRLEGKDGDLNDWVRAIELRRGRWMICEDTGYQGECLIIWGDNAQARLDRDLSGEWDMRISSIKPIACE